MYRFIVFDVNDTLLDLSAMDERFAEVLGDSKFRKEWFTQMLLSSMVLTATGKYQGFETVGRHALELLAKQHELTISPEQIQEVVSGMRTLPPHPEVPSALQKLREAGFRMAALTNSNLSMAREQLAFAGLVAFFNKLISVDSMRKFKPTHEVYEAAAQEMGAYPEELLMVAAHEWDITGAVCAGMSAAFVARPGKFLGPLSEKPNIMGNDLMAVAETIIANKDS